MSLAEDYRERAVMILHEVVGILGGLRLSGWDTDQKQWTEGELEQEVRRLSGQGQQTANPRTVLAQIVWRKLRESDVELDGLELASGFFGNQEHRWFELRFDDPKADPLPQVFLIDHAPVGVVAPALLLEPGSPFQLLYRRVG